MVIEKNNLTIILKLLFSVIFFITISLACHAQKSGEEYSKENISSFTDKIANASIIKKSDTYEIKALLITVGKFDYSTSYDIYKNKIYNGKVVSYKNNILGYFGIINNLSVIACEDGFDINGKPNGECKVIPEGEITIQMPYFPNGKYADIYDPFGKNVLTIDLTSKATCNENGKCDRPVEDSENCPQDCKNQEPKIDLAVVQLAANNQVAMQEAEKKVSLADLGWWGIAILIVLLTGGGIGYRVYRKLKS